MTGDFSYAKKIPTEAKPNRIQIYKVTPPIARHRRVKKVAVVNTAPRVHEIKRDSAKLHNVHMNNIDHVIKRSKSLCTFIIKNNLLTRKQVNELGQTDKQYEVLSFLSEHLDAWRAEEVRFDKLLQMPVVALFNLFGTTIGRELFHHAGKQLFKSLPGEYLAIRDLITYLNDLYKGYPDLDGIGAKAFWLYTNYGISFQYCEMESTFDLIQNLYDFLKEPFPDPKSHVKIFKDNVKYIQFDILQYLFKDSIYDKFLRLSKYKYTANLIYKLATMPETPYKQNLMKIMQIFDLREKSRFAIALLNKKVLPFETLIALCHCKEDIDVCIKIHEMIASPLCKGKLPVIRHILGALNVPNLVTIFQNDKLTEALLYNHGFFSKLLETQPIKVFLKYLNALAYSPVYPEEGKINEQKSFELYKKAKQFNLVHKIGPFMRDYIILGQMIRQNVALIDELWPLISLKDPLKSQLAGTIRYLCIEVSHKTPQDQKKLVNSLKILANSELSLPYLNIVSVEERVIKLIQDSSINQTHTHI